MSILSRCICIFFLSFILAAPSLAQSTVEDLQVARKLLEDGFAAEARTLLRDYVEENTEDYYALHMLGISEYQQGDHKEALRWFLISDSKDHGGSIRVINYQYMAQCYEILGDLVNALQFYQRYIESAPEDFATWHTMGSIAVDLGEYVEALEYLHRIPADYTLHDLVLLDLVKAHYHLEDYDQALVRADRLRTEKLHEEDRITFFYYLINAAIITEDFEYAFGIIEELERLKSEPSREVMSQYIMLALNTGHQDAGLRKGLEYCELFAPDTITYPLLSQYLEANFRQVSLQYFMDFARHSEEFTRLYLRKLYAENKFKTYISEYEKLQQTDAYLHLLYVRSLKKSGRTNEALEEISRALELYMEPQDQYPFHAIEYAIRHQRGMPVLHISQFIFENFPSPEAYFNYVTDLYNAQEFEELIRVLETYGSEGKERPFILYMAGNSAIELGEYERAIAYYLQVGSGNQSLELNTIHRIAYAYDMLEDNANALDYYRQALKLAGDNQRIRRNIEQRIAALELLQQP